MKQILDKIHTTGYWRVQIRPIVFQKDRIPSLRDCWKIVEDSTIMLRGWDYPHVDHDNRENATDYIGLHVDFNSHIEYWRLYQSGQFIHHFSCMEEYVVDPQNLSPLSVRTPSPSGKYLSVLATLYTLSEIFLFASKLASKQVLDPACEISITLNGMENRQLFFFDRSRYLRRAYVCQQPTLPYVKTYSLPELMSDYALHARVALAWIFERFQWLDISEGFFQEEQTKYLERNLN